MRSPVIALLVLSLAAPGWAGKPDKSKGQDKKKHEDKAHEEKAKDEVPVVVVDPALVFDKNARAQVGTWYGEHYGKGCPPGLAKKNNGCLPPGQAKKRYVVGHPLPADVKYVPLPPDLDRRIGPAPAGYHYVMLDGDVLKLAVGTQLVVDALDALIH